MINLFNESPRFAKMAKLQNEVQTSLATTIHSLLNELLGFRSFSGTSIYVWSEWEKQNVGGKSSKLRAT